MTAKKAATTAKHTSSAKHKTTSKHSMSKAQAAHLHTLHVEHVAHLAHLAATGKSVTVKATPAKPAKATKKVAFAVGDWLPVCGVQALAQSLRLAGQRVTDDELLELHYRAGGSATESVGIGDVLAAADWFGLAGCRPALLSGPGLDAASGPARPEDPSVPPGVGLECNSAALGAASRLAPFPAGNVLQPGSSWSQILLIDVPGPHAVLATPDGWWSWGELHSPWPATIQAAWAVSWP